MTMTARMRGAIGAGVIALLAGSIVGCAAQPAPTPTPTQTETRPATQSPSPTTPPAAFTCDELVPTSVLDSALGGTYTLNPSFEPEADSPAGQIAAAGGTACEWSDGAGATVLLAAGSPGAGVIESAKSEAARAGQTTDAFGSSLASFLSGEGGTTIDVFSEIGTWVHTESAAFTSATVAQPIVASVLQALPSGG